MNDIKWYSMFLDKTGNKFSIIRICLAFIVLMVMANWTWVNYNNPKELATIPRDVMLLTTAFAGAKVAQRFVESKPAATTTDVPPKTS